MESCDSAGSNTWVPNGYYPMASSHSWTLLSKQAALSKLLNSRCNPMPGIWWSDVQAAPFEAFKLKVCRTGSSYKHIVVLTQNFGGRKVLLRPTIQDIQRVVGGCLWMPVRWLNWIIIIMIERLVMQPTLHRLAGGLPANKWVNG